jgi:hypothetical protein
MEDAESGSGTSTYSGTGTLTTSDPSRPVDIQSRYDAAQHKYLDNVIVFARRTAVHGRDSRCAVIP